MDALVILLYVRLWRPLCVPQQGGKQKRAGNKIVKFCLSQNVGILVLEAYSFVYLVSVTDLYSVTLGHEKHDVCNHVTLSFLFVHFEINLSLCGLY